MIVLTGTIKSVINYLHLMSDREPNEKLQKLISLGHEKGGSTHQKSCQD